MSVRLLLLILALICFVLAALDAPMPVVELVPLGLALWVVATIVGKGK